MGCQDILPDATTQVYHEEQVSYRKYSFIYHCFYWKLGISASYLV